MIINKLVDINKLIDRFFLIWPFGFSPICLNVVFELTYLCNLSCPFCYLRIEEIEKGIKQKKILSKQQIFAIIDKIPAIASITFTGGEIFLIKDILEILAYAKKHHRLGLISNLTLNNREINKTLVDIGVDSLMFSIDGDKIFHNKMRGKESFKKTINNVKEIQQIKRGKNKKTPLLTMNTVIIPENVSFLEKLVSLAKELGVDCLNFQLLDPSIDRSGYRLFNNLSHLESNLKKISKIKKEILKISLKKAIKKAKDLNVRLTFSPSFNLKQILDYYQGKVDFKNFYCSKIFTSTRISPQGFVYPCYNLKIGNILENNFFNLFNSKKYQSFRQQVKKGVYTASCIGCCHFKLKNNL